MMVNSGHVPEWRHVGRDRVRFITRWSPIVAIAYCIIAVATATATIVMWRQLPGGNPTAAIFLIAELACVTCLALNGLAFLVLRRSASGDCVDLLRVRAARRSQIAGFLFSLVFGAGLAYVSAPRGYESYASLTLPPVVLMLVGTVAVIVISRQSSESD